MPDTPALAPDNSGVLGSTSGAQTGNVRAILAIACILGAHVLVAFIVVCVVWQHADFGQLATGLVSALVTADIGAQHYYFGRRAGEGA